MNSKRHYQLIERLKSLGFSYDEAQALRRIEMTLQRWAEKECGDSNDYCSSSVERDETTGRPFRVVMPHHLKPSEGTRTPIADREGGALKRLAKIMASHPDVVPYVQGDPRGCALYVVPKSALNDGAALDSVYTRGVAVCV